MSLERRADWLAEGKTILRRNFIPLPVAIVMALSWRGHVAARSGSVPEVVPASWSRYAGLVGQQFQAWLMGDDDVAYRLHEFLEDRAVSATEVPPGPLVIKVWIGPRGQVTRPDFSSLGAPQADADLRQELSAVPLSEPPPPDMRQPLVLRLNLQSGREAQTCSIILRQSGC